MGPSPAHALPMHSDYYGIPLPEASSEARPAVAPISNIVARGPFQCIGALSALSISLAPGSRHVSHHRHPPHKKTRAPLTATLSIGVLPVEDMSTSSGSCAIAILRGTASAFWK